MKNLNQGMNFEILVVHWLSQIHQRLKVILWCMASLPRCIYFDSFYYAMMSLFVRFIFKMKV